MGKIKISTKYGNVIICPSCKNSLGKSAKGLKDIDVSVICRCGEMTQFASNNINGKAKGAALLKNGSIICPSCEKEIMSVNFENISNFAFKSECDCGAIYEEYKLIEHKDRLPKITID